jgi:hypothetical protein
MTRSMSCRLSERIISRFVSYVSSDARFSPSTPDAASRPAATPLEAADDTPPLILLIAPAIPTPPGVCVVVPVGVVTVIRLLSLGSRLHSMRYPGGRKVLKPCINEG